MEVNCRDEVVDLHQFFEDWLGGKLANTEENFARLTAVMHPDFHIIGPEGTVTNYEALMASLRQAHNSRPGFRLWVKAVVARPLAAELALVTYEEWQEIEGKVNGRVSTAVFRQKANAPHGVEWLHVHETWLESGAENLEVR